MSASKRFAVAAALVAAAAVIVSSTSRSRAFGPGDEGGLEAEVLQRTIEDFENKLVVDPFNPVIGARLVSDHSLAFTLDGDANHLIRAEEIAARLVPRSLERATALSLLSSARLARHDFRGAHEAAIEAFENEPTAESSLTALFDAALGVGDYARARLALGGLTALPGASFSRAIRQAQWLEAHGHTARAIGMVETWCSKLRGRAVSRAHVAWCETRVGDLERGRGERRVAARWYGRAATTVPDYPAAIEGLAEIAYAQEHWERAAALYDRVVTDAHADIHLRLAEIAQALGDAGLAAEHERVFLRLATDPNADPFHVPVLALYLAEKPAQRAEALEMITRELERRQSVEILQVAAWVRLLNDDLSGAMEASDGSRSWGVPSSTNDYVRARILDALGRTDEAARSCERALADTTALEWYARRDYGRRAGAKLAADANIGVCRSTDSSSATAPE